MEFLHNDRETFSQAINLVTNMASDLKLSKKTITSQ